MLSDRDHQQSQSAISATEVGADAIIERARAIPGYGVSFKLKQVLVSRDNMALSLHNTAGRDGTHLDEHLTTVCRLREGRISEIETFLSDVPGMNHFFSCRRPLRSGGNGPVFVRSSVG